ncbi:MAG: hypothetical protein ABMA64_09840 [Myxococcota bacterium]
MLPLLSWASRFDFGEVAFNGRLHAPLRWDGVAPGVDLPAGPLRLRFSFSGGDGRAVLPAVASIEIVADGVRVEIIDKIAQVGTELRTPSAPVEALGALVDQLADPEIHVRARPAEALVLKLAPGVSASIPANAAIVLEAKARGPAERPRLVAPLVVSVGGTGLSIRLPGVRWVTTIASVGIRQASLAPDGGVELFGHAAPPFERAVDAGLRHASHHLSELVRTNPRFAGVRSFLDEDL